MKVIIAGSRSIIKYSDAHPHIHEFINSMNKTTLEIVSGKCSGPDLHGEQYAKDNDIVIKEFPAHWSLGKGAGFKRNSEMADYADVALILWDGFSSGTKDMISKMKQRNKIYKVIIINETERGLFDRIG